MLCQCRGDNKTAQHADTNASPKQWPESAQSPGRSRAPLTGPEGFEELSSITQTARFIMLSQPKKDEIVLQCSVQGGQENVRCAADMNNENG